ncbi:unnamed protein product [Porites lobata]|uniref:THAP-type domain-containing protein n=1 Tax=Porites lobata TaxID=104759 RepID=A0ABN8Q887_9CNID|nr:unnamed protein product [Porites lobata]
MVLCVVVGCGRKSGKGNTQGFFRIPSVVKHQGEEFEDLTTERRNSWISAISRDDTDTKNVLENERVCECHFVSGRPSPNWDKFNVDWIPTLNLGKRIHKQKDVEAATKRAERAKARRKRLQGKRKLLDQRGEQVANMDFREASTSTSSEIVEDHSGEIQPEEPDTQQPDISSAACAAMKKQWRLYFTTLKHRQKNLPHFHQSTLKLRLKSPFYTGLPSFEILMVAFEHVSPHVTRKTHSLSRFQEFVMVLMKLRLNVPFQDLAYRFMVSVPTVSRIFSSWLVVMDTRLFPLVSWPDREQLWKTMPMCFQHAFGRKVTVIIDCFEVFIERPSNLLARAQTFSSYKHHNTIKILIGITPQGTVPFVSEAWGGRTSDKYLTEHSGFLEQLLPGDMVMADRGFTIAESVGLKQAKLVIPAFTKGKSQLDPVDVEKTRGMASVRIHVERVIGLLRRKYTILESTLPTDFLACNPNGPPASQIPMIDRIVRVCSALINLCPPIIPFD